MTSDQEKRALAEVAEAAHYAQFLGIGAPWRVKRAELELAERKVDIKVEWDRARAVRCP